MCGQALVQLPGEVAESLSLEGLSDRGDVALRSWWGWIGVFGSRKNWRSFPPRRGTHKEGFGLELLGRERLGRETIVLAVPP